MNYQLNKFVKREKKFNMKTEYIESEIITEQIANVKYKTNIGYSSIFNTISLLFNDLLLENPSSLVLFSVTSSYGQTVFQFDIINTEYELNNEQYDSFAFELIKELSKINTKDVFTKQNFVQKLPSILNFIQKKSLTSNKRGIKC